MVEFVPAADDRGTGESKFQKIFLHCGVKGKAEGLQERDKSNSQSA